MLRPFNLLFNNVFAILSAKASQLVASVFMYENTPCFGIAVANNLVAGDWLAALGYYELGFDIGFGAYDQFLFADILLVAILDIFIVGIALFVEEK